MEQVLKFLYDNLNGVTETTVLFILIFFDTFLGSRWRKNQSIARTSGGLLEPLLQKMALALFPVLIWCITLVLYFVPKHFAGRNFSYNTFVFDLIAFIVFIIVANGTIKSITANMQLAGYEIPSWLSKWVADEYQVKLGGMAKEPAAVDTTETIK